MKKILLGLLAFIICVAAATHRSGWSYSGQNTFRIREPRKAFLYHDPNKAFPYDSSIGEETYFERELEAGEYVLTIEGYYLMELK